MVLFLKGEELDRNEGGNFLQINILEKDILKKMFFFGCFVFVLDIECLIICCIYKNVVKVSEIIFFKYSVLFFDQLDFCIMFFFFYVVNNKIMF